MKVYSCVADAVSQARKLSTFFRKKKMATNYAHEAITEARRQGVLKSHFLKLKKPRDTRLCSEHGSLQSLRGILPVLRAVTMHNGQAVRDFARVCGSKDKDLMKRREIIGLIHEPTNATERSAAEQVLEPTTKFGRHFDQLGCIIADLVPA